MDKTDQGMTGIIGMTLEEELSEKIWEGIRITEDRIIEEHIEVTIEMENMKEVGIGLEKDSIQENNRRNDRSSSSRSR